MAKADIERELVNPILEVMSTRKRDDGKKAIVRMDAEKQVGQFLIIHPEIINQINLSVTNGALTEAQSNQITSFVLQHCQTKEDSFRKSNPDRWAEMNSVRPSGTGKTFIISNYNMANNIRLDWVTYIQRNYLKSFEKSAITQGTNIGHGEFGVALAGVVAARGIAKINELASSASAAGKEEFFKQLITETSTISRTFTDHIGAAFDHTQIVTSDGQLRKDYNLTLSFQDAKGNNADSVGEGKALQYLRDKIKGDMLANLPGSDTLAEAVEGVLIHSMRKTAGKSFRSDKKTKSSYVSKTSGSKTKTVKRKEIIRVNSFSGPTKLTKKKEPVSFISLKALLDAKLPEEVKDRMHFPRLVNRTGRFANSVRVISVDETSSGAPSIAYTYMKNPYDVFKYPGGRMGTPDRDPRSLIEGSIRQIAIEAAVGRFYTRRI